jgi:hypothetical protein
MSTATMTVIWFRKKLRQSGREPSGAEADTFQRRPD